MVNLYFLFCSICFDRESGLNLLRLLAFLSDPHIAEIKDSSSDMSTKTQVWNSANSQSMSPRVDYV